MTERDTRITEDALCRAFAEEARESAAFTEFILKRTKFADQAGEVRLVWEEQAALRPKVASDRWWRHWWCKLPGIGREGETDIFLVFENPKSLKRFALHIEAKIAAPLSDLQASDYALRASHMLNKARFLSHSDFATILICPRTYAEARHLQAEIFDEVIYFEEIAPFVGDFALSRFIARS